MLNANYIRKKLEDVYELPYKTPSMHEVVFSDKRQAANGVKTGDIAKRLIDYGFHPYTVSFPLIVHGALMIEPTESESREELDLFIDAMRAIAREAEENPELVKTAPHSTRVSRLDEVQAARKPILRWKPKTGIRECQWNRSRCGEDARTQPAGGTALLLTASRTKFSICPIKAAGYTRLENGEHSSIAGSGYRGRLAPSPTGYLHVGHARTFWTAFQRAREAGGTLVMRMEDLDAERSRAEFAEAAMEDLRWLGIRWQEGPDKGGPYAPYVQSKRRASTWRRGASCCTAAACSRAAVRARTSIPRWPRRMSACKPEHRRQARRQVRWHSTRR